MKKKHSHSNERDSGLETRNPDEFDLLERALRELLIEKGIFSAEEVRKAIDKQDSRTPADGARVVARAWIDSSFKQKLLERPKDALQECGYDVSGPEPNLVVLEQTEKLHHVVVCTLCSCYPRALLGPPPDWYKSLEYRSRVVKDPRGVLAEFGTKIDSEVEIKVVDSTADMRYLILPQRPKNTKSFSESDLAKLVTRDCMVGVTFPEA